MSTETLIDLRSDTVTHPTPEMRQAMFTAVVDDDVLGHDPTVLQLEQTVASMLGKHSGLFVPSGTMANLIAVLTHCPQRGSEMILGTDSHIHFYEAGGSAVLGGIHSRNLTNQPDGTIRIEEIEKAIRPTTDLHQPLTRLICLENTHNRCGGTVLPVSYIDAVGELAHKHGLSLHMDGARLWNAAVKSGESLARIVQACDSVSVCLSKALGAPVGSVLVGSEQFIAQAKRVRKMLGGGMRQSGILAAAGLLSVNQMVDRLSIDHENTHLLATLLQDVKGLSIVNGMDAVQTNILFVELDPVVTQMDAAALRDRLKAEHNILVVAFDKYVIRFVTHYMVNTANIKQTAQAVKQILNPTN